MEPLNIYLAEELSGVHFFLNNKINSLTATIRGLESTILDKNLQLQRVEDTMHQFRADINNYQLAIQQLQQDYAKLQERYSIFRQHMLRENRFYKWMLDNVDTSGRTEGSNLEGLNDALSSSSRDEEQHLDWERESLG